MQRNHFVQSYTIACSVGDGSQAQAFLARRDNQLYVIKVYFSSPKALGYYTQQVNILTQINCPFIVRMVDHFAEARIFLGVNDQIRPAVILQFAEHGQLFKIVQYGRLSQDVSRTLFFQLMTALKHLKEVKIAHRDIKLQNILLDRRFNLKLADFGFAKNSQGENHDFYLRSWRGTESYMAPEIHGQLYRGQKVDVFAAGVVLFLMYVRIPPFENTEISNQKYNLIRQNKFGHFWALFERKTQPFPPAFKHLIEGMFASNPENRFTIEEVLNHQWVKGTQLTNEQLQTYLRPRYEKLINKDEETRNIKRSLREHLQRIANQNRRGEERQRSRSRDRQIGNRGAQSQNIIHQILASRISFNKLTQHYEYGLKYTKASPQIILLWVNHHFNTLQQKKNLFMQSLEEIKLSCFELSFDQKGKIEVLFCVDITSENDSVTTELKLQGQLLKWQDGISVLWKGKSGNQFWLYEIMQGLQQQFQLTFS